MNIHIIAQIYLPEPAGVFGADLARHWAEQGHCVTVWTASAGSTRGGVRIASFASTYDRSSLRGRIASQVGFFGRAAVELGNRARNDERPHVVVAVGSPALPTFLPPLSRRRSSRVIQWVYDLYPEALLALRPHARALRMVARPIAAALNLAWRRADAVVAISPRMAARVRQRAPGANVHAIPLWAPAGVDPRTDRAPALRRARGVAEDAFVVMYHGNLGLAYDFEPLFGAAHALSGDPRIVFAIVGDGAQCDMLVERAANTGLANVRIFPPVDFRELPDSLAMGDCHIIGVREGWDALAFPSKFISAVAAGRPVLVVGPPETELAEMVRSNRCGAVVPPDGDAIADAVRWLREHPDGARDQGNAGRAAYERIFDRGKAFAEWDALVASFR